MFLFAREKYLGAQGKNREPGLQENSVRNFTGRRGPVLGFCMAFIFRKSLKSKSFILQYFPRKWVILIRGGSYEKTVFTFFVIYTVQPAVVG